MPKKKPEPTPKPNALVIRGSKEWRDWLKEMADLERVSVAELIDRALVTHAKKLGIKQPIPRR